MKTCNTKLGAIVFIITAALDAMVVSVMFSGYSAWALIPWVVINFPGYPVFRFIQGMLQPSPLMEYGSVIGCALFSTLFWSVVAGFVFRRRYAA